MPNQKPDADAALRKLGQRLREGHAIKHPAAEKDLQAVRKVVRDQYQQEQKAEREKAPEPEVTKDRDRKPDEPDQDR